MTVLLALLRRIPGEVWLGLLLVAMLLSAGLAIYNAGHNAATRAAETEIRELQAQVDDMLEVHRAQQDVIGQLQKVNRELAEGREADQEAAAIAVAELASERDALARELDRRRNDRGVIYERDESAAAWARARVPDAVARSLRD